MGWGGGGGPGCYQRWALLLLADSRRRGRRGAAAWVSAHFEDGCLGKQILDADGNGQLSFEELRVGLMLLRVSPTILLTEEDFESFTQVWTTPPPL